MPKRTILTSENRLRGIILSLPLPQGSSLALSSSFFAAFSSIAGFSSILGFSIFCWKARPRT